MKYSQFELLVLALGGAAIVGGMLMTYGTDPDPAEVVAQLLVLFVLGGAVHWGRNGGFVAAMIATVVYVVMRLPLLTDQGLTAELVAMIAVRVLTYGVVGIVGGEMCGRVKYVFARFDKSPLIDEHTGVFNGRYAASAISTGIGHWQRYGTPYSVVELTLDPSLLEGLRPLYRRAFLRRVANHVRNDIRLVDDLAHAGDGRFLVMLPHTDAGGAAIAGDRLHRGTAALLTVEDPAVETTVLSCDRNVSALHNLVQELDLEDAPPAAQQSPNARSLSVDA